MQNRCYGPVDIALLVPSLRFLLHPSSRSQKPIDSGANFRVLAKQARGRGISVDLDHLVGHDRAERK